MSGRYTDDSAALAEVMRDVPTIRREVDPDGDYDRMGEQPVLCRDCSYASVGTFVDCRHPSNLKPDLVVGGLQARNSARFMREEGPCGVVGLYFKER